LQRRASIYKEMFISINSKVRSMTSDLKVDLVEKQSKINSIRKSYLAQIDEYQKQIS